MTLPLRGDFRGQSPARFHLTTEGLSIDGRPPRLDTLVFLWEAIMDGLATEAFGDIGRTVGRVKAKRLAMEARAAVDVKTRGTGTTPFGLR